MVQLIRTINLLELQSEGWTNLKAHSTHIEKLQVKFPILQVKDKFSFLYYLFKYEKSEILIFKYEKTLHI